MRRVVDLGLVLLVAGAFAAQAQVGRILIVGDSWAMSVATDPVDGPEYGFGSFDSVLDLNDLGGYGTQGSQTAWGGRKASDWAQASYLARITQELQTYPSIDIVHLILGGNDFLAVAADGVNIMSYTPGERAAFWAAIRDDLQTVVDHCLAQRPDVRVVIADYDYLDAAAATAFWSMDFGGATPRQLNDAFVELGQQKLAIAQGTSRCEYVSNWGVLHSVYNHPVPGLPAPGAAPDYSPYTGGDIDAAMPPGVAPDGIHPNDEAHQYLLERSIDQYYWEWLTESGEQPDTDSDGLADGDELRDLNPAVAGTQNPFDPFDEDSTGDSGSSGPDGTLDGENDYDGDGFMNAMEFGQGTNPLDPASVPTVPAMAGAGLVLVAALLAASAKRYLGRLPPNGP